MRNEAVVTRVLDNGKVTIPLDGDMLARITVQAQWLRLVEKRAASRQKPMSD